VAVAGNDNSLIIVWIIDHCLENQFSVDITFDATVRKDQRWFEDEDEPCLLEEGVKLLVRRYKTHEEIGCFNVIFVTKMNTEARPVQFPAKTIDRQIDILAVDEGVDFFIGGCHARVFQSVTSL